MTRNYEDTSVNRRAFAIQANNQDLIERNARLDAQNLEHRANLINKGYVDYRVARLWVALTRESAKNIKR